MPTKRQQVLADATPAQMETYARRLGFPSATAFHAIVELGQRLQAGERVTASHVKEIASYYPNLTPSVVQQYADNINAQDSPQARMDALIGTVYDPSPEGISQGRELISGYAVESVADTLSQRLDGRAAANTAVKSTPSRKHEPDTLRGDLVAALRAHGGPTREELKEQLSPHVRGNLLADRLEANILRGLEVKEDPHSSIGESLAVAWDKHEAMDEGMEELATDDIPQET